MSTPQPAQETAMAAVDAAIAKGALAPVLLDVAGLSAYTDFLLIVSAKNTRQVRAIAEHLQRQLKQRGTDPLGIEGESDAQWKLLDFGNLVVHVFFHPLRLYYDLEGIWSEAKRVRLSVPAELRVVDDVYE